MSEGYEVPTELPGSTGLKTKKSMLGKSDIFSKTKKEVLNRNIKKKTQAVVRQQLLCVSVGAHACMYVCIYGHI